MESTLAVSCIFQAVMAEGGAHRRGRRDPAHCLTVLGERLEHLWVAVGFSDMRLFPVFSVVYGNGPFGSKKKQELVSIN